MTLRPALSLLRLAALFVAASSACLMAHATPTGLVATIQPTGDPNFTGTFYEQDSPTVMFFGNLHYTVGGQTYDFDASQVLDFGTGLNSNYQYIVFTNSNTDTLVLEFEIAPYQYSGNSGDFYVCSTSHYCTAGSSNTAASYILPALGDITQFSQGTLHVTLPNVGATPEPSSIALLGTGALGVLGAARRRFTRA